jgi:hypothetical protein
MTWLEFWDTVSVLQILGWILGILGIVGFIVKGWPKVKATVRLVDALSVLPDFIGRTDSTLTAHGETLVKQNEQLAGIYHETHKNDGSSIKDATVRTENAVERIELGVKGLYDRVDGLDAADVAATAIVAQLREDLDQTLTPEQIKRLSNPKETR